MRIEEKGGEDWTPSTGMFWSQENEKDLAKVAKEGAATESDW